jgi:hypothetical protein
MARLKSKDSMHISGVVGILDASAARSSATLRRHNSA